MSVFELKPSDALIIVDVQNDFCPGGLLPVEGGDQVVPVLNQWILVAVDGGAMIAASRDWHPPGHMSFADQGGAWPVHCLSGSPGARFHMDLNLPREAKIVTKGDNPAYDQYSALDRTGLEAELKSLGVKRLWVGGLALDVCVKATVLDALKAGFETHVIKDACRAVNIRPDDGEKALREMSLAGAIIEQGHV